MKILHVFQRDDPDTGGALRVCEALVREQRLLGAEVWILFLYGEPGHLYEDLAPHAVCLRLSSSREAARGFLLYRKAIKQINPDIIHSHDGILWPRLVYLNRSIPVVTHAHSPPGDMSRLKDKLGWPLTSHTTDCLVGISQHTIGMWKNAGYTSDNIECVPNGVDFKRFTPVDDTERIRLREELSLPQDRRILIWVGRLHNGTKGTDRVEKVAALLPDGMCLVVVGQGPDYEGMCERCKAPIEDGRMMMIGSSPFPENYYKAADYYLFSSYQDAFGLVILEAVACELPMLSFTVTKGGGAVELLHEFGAIELSDDLNATALNHAIDVADERRNTRSSLREKAMKTYSWSALSAQLLEIYDSVIKSWRKAR